MTDDAEERRWQRYLWQSETGEPMLANLYGLRDAAELRAREYAETTKRAVELQLGRKHIPATRDLTEWQAVHAHLFGNVYDWAGQLRTVGMGKADREFLRPEDFEIYLPVVFDHARHIDWAQHDRDEFVDDAAWLCMHLSWAHPFREGNGRTTRLVLDRFTSASRWRLDFTRIEPQAWRLASQDATPSTYRPPDHPGLLHHAISSITVLQPSTRLLGRGGSPDAQISPAPQQTSRQRTQAEYGDGAGIRAAIRAAGLTAAAPDGATTSPIRAFGPHGGRQRVLGTSPEAST